VVLPASRVEHTRVPASVAMQISGAAMRKRPTPASQPVVAPLPVAARTVAASVLPESSPARLKDEEPPPLIA